MKPSPKQFQVKTDEPARPDATPRLPHERDESDDSQTSAPREKIKQAYADVKSGLQDTSRTGVQGPEDPHRDKVATPDRTGTAGLKTRHR
jgi:hypothetical protein